MKLYAKTSSYVRTKNVITTEDYIFELRCEGEFCYLTLEYQSDD